MGQWGPWWGMSEILAVALGGSSATFESTAIVVELLRLARLLAVVTQCWPFSDTCDFWSLRGLLASRQKTSPNAGQSWTDFWLAALRWVGQIPLISWGDPVTCPFLNSGAVAFRTFLAGFLGC